MDKHSLAEADIRTKFITPAIVGPSGGRTVGPGGGCGANCGVIAWVRDYKEPRA
jgi:hypothetical protein